MKTLIRRVWLWDKYLTWAEGFGLWFGLGIETWLVGLYAYRAVTHPAGRTSDMIVIGVAIACMIIIATLRPLSRWVQRRRYRRARSRR